VERFEPVLITANKLDSWFDIVLLSVKATALQQSITDLAPAVGPDTTIIPFLNGISHLDALNRRFPRARTLTGVVKVVTQLNADGDIVRLAPLASLEVGEQDPDAAGDLSPVLDTLRVRGYDLSVSRNGMEAMWSKWVYIASIGALTCLMRGAVGDVVACPGGEDLAHAIIAEAVSVAARSGHKIPADDLETTTALLTERDSPLTSSMYRDVVAGAGTEVEHILGDLTYRARAKGLATPLLDLAKLHLRVYEHRRTSAP
jgi:2-dehydropantoate 2-reductase